METQSAIIITEPVAAETELEVQETDNDEDYKWLTERLDAHSAKLTGIQTAMEAELSALRLSQAAQTDQSKTMIESLTTLVQTLSTNLTNLSTLTVVESSRLTPENSVSLSPVEEQALIVAKPENQSSSVENEVQTNVQRKRRQRI